MCKASHGKQHAFLHLLLNLRILHSHLAAVTTGVKIAGNDISIYGHFYLVYFSLESVEIWNTEILLTASVDCTVRLWTMDGHFVGMFLFVLTRKKSLYLRGTVQESPTWVGGGGWGGAF